MRYGIIVKVLFFVSGISCSNAQQNFFNVPSSEITKRNKSFFQQQINLNSSTLVSNSTFSYGVGQNFEVGLNLIGITYSLTSQKFISSSPKEEPLFPSFGFNAQKLFKISDRYSIALGGQLLLPSEIYDDEWYMYLNNKLAYNRLKGIIGIYCGDNYYFDSETRFNQNFRKAGIQIGVEYEIVRDKFYFQADFISGKTVLSNLITGIALKAGENIILSAGYQIANFKKTSSNGLVFEFTLLPID